MIDLSAVDPVGALDSVRKELREYARMKGLEGNLEARVKGVVANKADLFGPSPEELANDEDPSLRSTTDEGQKKLGELEKYVREMEAREVEEGIRTVDDEPVWIVPTSAKNRQNVAALVKKLAGTIRLERAKTLALIAEEDRLAEEEKDLAAAA